jgi:hypothetical protein
MVTVRERVRAEVDIMVGRATFLVRSTSLRYPGTARTIKRILGLPEKAPAGATAWADATPTQPQAKQPGEPHISLTRKSKRAEQNVSARDDHAS